MVNERITGFTGSPIALDELIERERVSAAKAIEAAFQHDIRVAIIRVGEINTIASARITATAQVATAKAATDAEVSAATLAVYAHEAVAQLKRRASGVLHVPDDVNALILATSGMANEKISAHALEVLKVIESEAKAAVDAIRNYGADAISRIKSLSDETTTEIDKNASHALEKLVRLKSTPRMALEVIQHAIEAESLLVEQFEGFKVNLDNLVTKSKSEVVALADRCVGEISSAVSGAEKRVVESRDKAIEAINRYAGLMQK
jgi:hypothetical protein